MDKVINVENACLTINKNVILDNIDFEAGEGEIVGIVGRNGSGKTMLMKCICGFIPLTSGRITVDGKEIGKDVDFPASTGVIIETPGFVPYYTGFHNLKILSEIGTRIPDERIKEAMKLVGLDPGLKRHVGKYSLGMRQRLGIAQAIMEDQRILILDEPFNGLDADGVVDIRRLLLEYKEQDRTVLIASHIAQDINILCDKTIFLNKGKISEQEALR